MQWAVLKFSLPKGNIYSSLKENTFSRVSWRKVTCAPHKCFFTRQHFNWHGEIASGGEQRRWWVPSAHVCLFTALWNSWKNRPPFIWCFEPAVDKSHVRPVIKWESGYYINDFSKIDYMLSRRSADFSSHTSQSQNTRRLRCLAACQVDQLMRRENRLRVAAGKWFLGI